MSLQPRPYQVEAKVAAVLPPVDGKANLIVLPTGTGKTVVFSGLIAERRKSALVLAHRDELLDQAAAKIAEVAPELAMAIGFVKGPRNDTHSQIVVASVQTLARENRLRQLPELFDLVIVDEAHHAAAASYKRILAHVSGSTIIVGFTATASRAGLKEVFELRYSKGLLEMIEAGYLSDLKGVRVELALDLGAVRRSNRGRGDFVDSDLGEAMEEADATARTVDAWQEYAKGRKGIVFCPTVALSEDMAKQFRAADISAAHLDGTTPKERRRALLEAFHRGEIDVISNVGVLTEGFDEPAVDCVVIARPTKSPILYAQMVGRGTRLYPGKEDCLILDLAGASDELSLESLPKLIGVKKVREGESATEAFTRESAAGGPTQMDTSAERARKAKLRGREFGFFNRDRIRWRRGGSGRFAVSLGKDYLVLDPTGDERYRVLRMESANAKVIARDLDLGYAMGAAEQEIRDSDALGLVDKDARWRERPASSGQIGKARSLGLRLHRGVTMGEASDAIDGAILRDRISRFDAAIAARTENANEGSGNG